MEPETLHPAHWTEAVTCVCGAVVRSEHHMALHVAGDVHGERMEARGFVRRHQELDGFEMPDRSPVREVVGITNAEHGAWVHVRLRELLAMSPAELNALEARHRAAGYGRASAAVDTLGSMAPVAAPITAWEHCDACGADLPAGSMTEHRARAADVSVWSLCRARIENAAMEVMAA